MLLEGDECTEFCVSWFPCKGLKDIIFPLADWQGEPIVWSKGRGKEKRRGKSESREKSVYREGQKMFAVTHLLTPKPGVARVLRGLTFRKLSSC